MAEVGNILKFWQKQTVNDDSVLIADFEQLVAMRRDVPYLRDFKFKNSSLQAGDYKSSFKGRGMEFEEVRAYSYGDDVRDIDWRVTARKNQPYTKLYAEEKDRQVYVWLDLSSAMLFGTQKELKSVTAAKTAALLGWFALANKDRFGMAVFDGEKTWFFEPQRTEQNLLAVLKKISQISRDTLKRESEAGDVVKSLQILRKKIGRRAIVFLVSDFSYFLPRLKDFRKEMIPLSRNSETCLIKIYDALEVNAPPAGEYLAEYKGFQQLLRSGGKEFTTLYHTYFSQKRKWLQDFCRQLNCRYREIKTDEKIFEQLRPI